MSKVVYHATFASPFKLHALVCLIYVSNTGIVTQYILYVCNVHMMLYTDPL